MVSKKLLTVLTGLAAVAAAAACATHQIGTMDFDVESPITIRKTATEPKRCAVSSKEPVVRVHKDKWLELKFSNYCDEGVRPSSETSGPPRIRRDYRRTAAIRTWWRPPIFRESDPSDFKTMIDSGDPSHAKTKKIKLKVKNRGDLGNDELIYYYDVCIDGTKHDPQLVIER